MSTTRIRMSLTLQVTMAFVAIVVLTASGLGMFLYQSFVQEIVHKDDIQLLGKLRQVQQLIENPDTPNIIIERPQYFRDTMSGQENALVRIVQRDGHMLLDINPQQEQIAYPPGHKMTSTPDPDALLDWTSRHGYPGRMVAGMAIFGKSRESVTITVARAYAERTELFAAYRRKIVASVLLSAALAAILATYMLRRGLQPLRKMAAHAALVRPDKLEQQLDTQDAPSELLPLIQAFNAMLARLQEGYSRLSQFSTDLAHEFRTPVSSLLGQSEVMLTRPRSTEEYKQLVMSNMEELERLSRMIDSMLFLARAEREQMRLQKEAVSIEIETQRLCEFFEGMAQERSLTVDCQARGVVMADAQLLRRALGNLLSNAIRHAYQDSVIHLSSTEQDGHVVLSVTNTGATIAPAHLPHLFDRFYRVDAARSDSAESTGLGLAIVNAIMTLHQGHASVSSHDETTCLSLYFPRL